MSQFPIEILTFRCNRTAVWNCRKTILAGGIKISQPSLGRFLSPFRDAPLERNLKVSNSRREKLDFELLHLFFKRKAMFFREILKHLFHRNTFFTLIIRL